MSKMTKVAEGVVRDENGKLHIAPMKLPTYNRSPCSSAKKKSGERRSVVRRPYIPIKPISVQFTDLDDSPQNASKKRKTERQVCRGLFKEPQKKSEKKSSLYNGRCSISGKRPSPSLQIKVPKIVFTNDSPLLDIDEAEQLLKKKTLVKTVLFPMASIKEESTLVNITNDDGNTPTKANSDERGLGVDTDELEFLQLEKELASARKSKNNEFPSPVSSVCVLLKNTKITNSGKKTEATNDNGLEEIMTLMNEDRKQFTLLKEQFENFWQQYNEHANRINELLGKSAENKENINDTSVEVSTMQAKYVISPAIANKVDLRKSTLNKNLSKTLHCDSPRTRKAVNMYNNIRNDCSVLCTPKLDRSTMDVTQNNVTRSLSRRIQKQCLLLQDTPKPSS